MRYSPMSWAGMMGPHQRLCQRCKLHALHDEFECSAMQSAGGVTLPCSALLRSLSGVHAKKCKELANETEAPQAPQASFMRTAALHPRDRSSHVRHLGHCRHLPQQRPTQPFHCLLPQIYR